MPELAQRDDIERDFAREMADALGEYMDDVVGDLGSPPNFNNISEETWRRNEERMQRVLTAVLLGVFLTSAEGMLQETPIGVEWGGINEAAATWARQYSYDLVRQLQATDRRFLQTIIPRFFEQEITLEELRASLIGNFGPVRADMIAVTETTRAAIEGERVFIQQLAAMGAQYYELYRVAGQDACVLCLPDADKPRAEWMGGDPPRHPRCRCWLDWVEVMLPEA